MAVKTHRLSDGSILAFFPNGEVHHVDKAGKVLSVEKMTDNAIYGQTGQKTILNEQGQTVNELGQRIDQPFNPQRPEQFKATPPIFTPRNALPAIGATVGGGLGILLPFPGTEEAGAVLGGGIGQMGLDYLNEAEGIKKPTTLTQKIGSGLGEGAAQLLPLELGKLIYGISKIPTAKNTFEKGLVNTTKKVASQYGTEVAPEEAGIAIGNKIENNLGKRFNQAGNEFELQQQKNIKNTQNTFTQALIQQSNKYGNKPLSRLESGASMKSEFGNIVNTKRAIENKLWQDIPKDTPVSNESDTKDFLEKLFQSKGFTAKSSGGLNFTFEAPGKQIFPGQEVTLSQSSQLPIDMSKAAEGGAFSPYSQGDLYAPLNSLSANPYNRLHSVLKDLSNKDLTFDDLKQMRTYVGTMANFDDVRASGLQATYKKVYGLLTNDLKRSAEEGGVGETFKKANDFTKEYINFLESDAGQALYNKDPEAVMDSLVKENSPTKINTVMNEFSDNGKKIMRRSFLDNVNRKSSGDPKKFSDILESYDSETMKALFGKDVKDVYGLSDFAKKTSELTDELSKQKFTGQGFNQNQIDLVKMIRNTNASTFINKIIGGDKEFTRTAVDSLDATGKDYLKRGILYQLLEKSNKKIGSETETSIVSIANNIQGLYDKLGNDGVKYIFGKDTDLLNNLSGLANYGKENIASTLKDDILISIRYNPFYALRGAVRLFQKGALEGSVGKITAKNLVGRSPEEIMAYANSVYPQTPFARDVSIAAFRAPFSVNRERYKNSLLRLPIENP